MQLSFLSSQNPPVRRLQSRFPVEYVKLYCDYMLSFSSIDFLSHAQDLSNKSTLCVSVGGPKAVSGVRNQVAVILNLGVWADCVAM